MSSDVYESFINTIRAEAWDEGIAAFVQYYEGLMIAEMDRAATIQAEILQGLRESGNGEMHDLGSFAEPATEPWTDPTPWPHDHPAEWCRENGKRYRDPGGVGNIYAPRSRAEYDAEEGKR